MTIREALTQSLNVPAVVVLDAVGPSRLVARLKRSGATPATAGPLGAGSRRRPRRRRHQPPRPDGGLCGARPRRFGNRAPRRRRRPADRAVGGAGSPVLEPLAAWYVADILAGTPPPVNGSPGRIAYKTGTSYGYRDAWSLGFDGRHVVGIWVGRPDGSPVPGLSGIMTAAPILFEAFDRIGGEALSAERRRRRAPSSPRPPPCRSRFAVSAIPNEVVVAQNTGPGDRLSARRRRRRSRPQGRRPGPALHQGQERRPALHLLRQWRADRALALRPHGKLAAGRIGLRDTVGGRRGGQIRPRDGVRGVRRDASPL